MMVYNLMPMSMTDGENDHTIQQEQYNRDWQMISQKKWEVEYLTLRAARKRATANKDDWKTLNSLIRRA